MADDADLYHFVYTWTIKNFSSSSLKPDGFMYSPWTLAESLDKTKWRFRLYPKGLKSKEMPCFLYRAEEDDGPKVVEVNGDIGIVDANGEFIKSSDPFRARAMERGDNEGTVKFLTKGTMFGKRELYLPNDSLTIQCRLRSKSLKKSMTTRCSAVSEILVDKCLFQWNIRKFDSFHSNNTNRIYVPLNLKIEMEFHLSGRSGSDEDGFVVVAIKKNDKKPFYLRCLVTLLDKDGFPSDAIKNPIECTFTNEITSCLMPKSELLHNRKFYEHDGVVTFQIELLISDGTTDSRITELYQVPYEKTLERSRRSSDLKKDLSHLYLERKFTDVQLKTEDGTFPAHRNVLSARSPVFQAMFEQDMFESKSGVVEITDIDSSTLDNLLMFMYSDTLADLDCESTFKLYSAAGKYFFENLKVECEKRLVSKLSLENALETLLFSDMHNAEHLKTKAEECVMKNAGKVLATEEWHQFINANPSLASKIVMNLSKMVMQTRKLLK